jgi:hypothetical protein
MTLHNIPTPGEMLEQLRSTHQDPFVTVTRRPVPTEVAAVDNETYAALRREFDNDMRRGVSLKRMAALSR